MFDTSGVRRSVCVAVILSALAVPQVACGLIYGVQSETVVI